MSNNSHPRAEHHPGGQYLRLGLMAILSFIAMYVLMYAMVNASNNVLANVNQVYMAGLMVASMIIIELLLMAGMYSRRAWNLAIGVASLVVGIAFWFAIRQQLAVGDRQFLRSMIPHHASAILMCQHANITDGEIRTLCRNIVQSQQSEIDQMKALLQRLR